MHSDLLYVENSNLESGNRKNPRKMPNIVHRAIYRLDLQRNVSLLYCLDPFAKMVKTL